MPAALLSLLADKELILIAHCRGWFHSTTTCPLCELAQFKVEAALDDILAS